MDSAGKHIFEYKYDYVCRITSRLIEIAHFFEVLEVEEMFLSLMQFGGFNRPVKWREIG